MAVVIPVAPFADARVTVYASGECLEAITTIQMVAPFAVPNQAQPYVLFWVLWFLLDTVITDTRDLASTTPFRVFAVFFDMAEPDAAS